jgi:twitching motility protein PilJ
MEFKLPAIKLPFSRREMPAARSDRPRGASAPLPLIGHLPVGRQFAILIAGLVALLLLDAIVVSIDARQGTYGTVYVASAGRIRMLSQRLSKAALQASQGNPVAFKQLRDSRDEFTQLVKLLADGGASGEVNLPRTPDDVRPALDALIAEWK